MKKLTYIIRSFIVIIISSFVASSMAAQSIRELFIGSNHSHYIAAQQSLYAHTTDFPQDPNANQLIRIDPFFAKIKERWPVGEEPRFLTASTDQSVLFMIAEKPRRLKRFNLQTKTIDRSDEIIVNAEQWEIENIIRIPKDNEQVLFLINTGDSQRLAIYKRGQAQSILRITTNQGSGASIGFSNDSTMWMVSPRVGEIARYKLRKSTLVLERSFPGYLHALDERFTLVENYLVSDQGQYIGLRDEIPQIEGRLKIQFRGRVSFPENSQYFYVHDQFSEGQVFLRRFRRNDLKEDGPALPLPRSTFLDVRESFQAFRDDLFAYNNFRILWNCQSRLITPVLEGPPSGRYCLNLDNDVTLNANQSAAEYFWYNFSSSIPNAQAVLKLNNQDGYYALQLSDSLGCLTARSAALSIVFRRPPDRPTITESRGATSPINICKKETKTLQTSGGTKIEWSSGDTTYSIKTDKGGNWRVRIKDFGNCWSAWSDTFKLIAIDDTLPAKPILTSTGIYGQPFCPDSLTIIGPKGYKYYGWTSGGLNNSHLNTFRFFGSIFDFPVTLQVSDNRICWSPFSDVFQIKTTSQPSKPQITRSSNVLSSNYSNPIFVHEWSFNGQVIPNANGQFLPITREGFYSVKVRQGSCFSPSSDLFNFGGFTTASQDNKLDEKGPILFPNPVTDELQIANLQAAAKLQIMDTQGKVLGQYQANNSAPTRIRVHHLPAGLYFLQAQSGARVWNLRFVKE
jgi:hypothetical protein